MTTKQSKKLLFIKPLSSPFILKDEELLSTLYDVTYFDFQGKKGFSFMWRGLIFLWFYLTKGFKNELCLIWFADFHAVLPIWLCKIFNKKSAIILGGSDVNNVSEINYGSNKTVLKKRAIDYCISNSTVLFPVSNAMKSRLKKKYGSEILAKTFHLPTGYDHKKWHLGNDVRSQIITVASFNTKERYLVKGIDRFVELARLCPKIDFVIIGGKAEANTLISDPPPNLILKGFMSPSELAIAYNQSTIYLQLSRSEGLPNVMCEAMLCGCYPIGTNVGGIPELIEKHGTIVRMENMNEIAEVIKDIHQDTNIDRQSFRAHIMDHYNMERRSSGFEVHL